jgi:pyruvate kinase
MMHSLVVAAEEGGTEPRMHHKLAGVDGDWEISSAAARAAAILSHSLPLMAIVVVTSDGRSADLLSSYRPGVPIIAITDDQAAAQRLAIRWGITPHIEPPTENFLASLELARTVLHRDFPKRKTGAFALVTGFPKGRRTNTVTLQQLFD